MRRNPLILVILIVASLMTYATLYPLHFRSEHSDFLMWNQNESRSAWLDIVLNLYFFVPLGVLVGFQFRSRPAFFLSFVVLALFSIAIELAQAFIPGRNSSLRDVLLNSMGAFCGMLLANLPFFDREMITNNVRKAIGDLGTVALISMFGIYLFFPFLPVFRTAGFHRFLHTPLPSNAINFEIVEIAAYCSFTVLFWRSRHSAKSTAIFALICAGLTPAQIFLWGRAVTPVQVGAAMIGFALGLLLSRRPQWIQPRILAPVAIGFLLWRELQPFEWTTGSPGPFHWIPFAATFANSRDAALRVLALKCFIYWFTVVQIHRALPATMWRSALGVASIVLLAELGQCFQPSRTPEITDSLLCLFAAAPLWNFDGRQNQGL